MVTSKEDHMPKQHQLLEELQSYESVTHAFFQ